MSGWLRQAQYSIRALMKTPSFTWTAVFLVGLGVGAVTTIYTLVDHILLRPLPYPEPDRLVLVENGNHSGPLFREMQTMSTVEHWAAALRETTTLLGEGTPLRLVTTRVSRDFFQVFDARATRGRLFAETDFANPGSTVVVDGRAWRRLWDSDPGLVGSIIRLDDQPVTVVGITDPSFEPPEGEVGREVDLWRPLDWSSDLLNSHTAWVLRVAGRLSPGASLEAARQEMGALMTHMAPVHENYRDREGNPRELPVTPLSDVTVRGVRTGLGLLLGAVLMLLLVACANVAQLFLARSLGRHREMAVRRAVGAGTGALVGQLMVESLLVGLAGGLVGLGLAWVGLRGFLGLTPDALPRQSAVGLDFPVLIVAAAISAGTALIFGLLPAVRVVRRNVSDQLRGAGSTATSTSGPSLLRRGLVVGEVALSLVLTVGAGLLLRSFLLVHAQDPGFRTEGLWTAPLSLTSVSQPQDWINTMQEVGEATARVPGVEGVAWGLTMPLTTGGSHCCWRATVNSEGDSSESPWVRPVNAAYFTTLGIPLRAGRSWTPAEARADPALVVVSEGLATALWGGADQAINRLLGMGDLSMTVVGVSGDVRHFGLDEAPAPGLYVPSERLPFDIDQAHLAVRLLPGASQSVGRDLREAIWSVAPGVPVPVVRAMDDWLGMETSSRRFDSFLFGTFAGLALLLAAGGLYGTLLYMAGERRRELGIRLALGATQGRIVRDVVRGGVAMALLGVVLGLGGAWASGRLLESRLWGVSPGDPIALLAAASLLLATAGLASWFPARRAGRTDPLETLKAE